MEAINETNMEAIKETRMEAMEETEMEVSYQNNDKENDGLIFFSKKDGVFGLEELLGSQAEFLGRGNFGSSYKAILEERQAVLVKRLKNPHAYEPEKIHTLGEIVHENLLPLRAYYYGKEEALLVYNYMPRGSLLDFLQGKSRDQLSWQARGRIAYGVARGIECLHSRGSNVCHGNIRSSNILLTQSLDARLSEFGIAQIPSFDSKTRSFSCYQAPEVTNANEVSQKSDVYSFGVLLLELLTGRTPRDALIEGKGEDLPNWVRLVTREKPIIQYPKNRPTMAVVAKRIKDILLF
ncbi:Non-specific serine/threonine protein kinase [Bertholletia excelsa]